MRVWLTKVANTIATKSYLGLIVPIFACIFMLPRKQKNELMVT